MYVREGDFVMLDLYGFGFGELRLVPSVAENNCYF